MDNLVLIRVAAVLDRHLARAALREVIEESQHRLRIVFERPDVKVLLLDAYEGPTVSVEETIIQDTGAPIIWFVFPERWHDIGRFHTRDEAFTGWYTNFCRPPEFHGTRWVARDLFLDCWQPTLMPITPP